MTILIQTIFWPLSIWFRLWNRLKGRKKIQWVELNLKDSLDEGPQIEGLITWLKPPAIKFHDLALQAMEFDRALTNGTKRKGKLVGQLQEWTIRVSETKFGWSRAWEIQQLIRRLREKGVRVRAYLETPSNLAYFSVLSADEIYIPPAMNLDFTGFRAESIFMRGFFDRWGIKPDFIHIGNYKSAAERYTRKSMSKYAKEQIQELLHERMAQVAHAIKAFRSSKVKKSLSSLQKNAPLDAMDAARLGLVDGVCYYNQLLATIRQEHEWKESRKPIPFFDAGRLLAQKETPLLPRKKPMEVLLLSGEGPIINAKENQMESINYKDYVSAIDAVEPQKYQAVILRWNSPGGSALVSDLLWQRLMGKFVVSEEPYFDKEGSPFVTAHKQEDESQKQPKKKRKRKKKMKPESEKTKGVPSLYVSQSDVAASGGYYLSALNQNVYATPLTITGSIGVIAGKFNVSGLLVKAGFSIQQVEEGENGGIYSPYTSFNSAQKKLMKENMTRMYALFRNRISIGRGMPDSVIEKLGGGRVYSGEKALRLGLVDHSGGYAEIIDRIREELQLDPSKRVRYTALPVLKGGLFRRSDLIPGIQISRRVQRWLSLSKENILFMDERLL